MEQSPAASQRRSERANERLLPTVAVVIPTLNEAASLGRTLAALLHQDYPADRYEILVVDGGSKDGTQDIAMSFHDHGVHIRLIDNPGRSIPAAVNLALKSTDSETILWLSGHCVLAPDYLGKSARAFTDAPNRATGGYLEVDGEGVSGKLNAMLLSSRFGTGMSPFRFSREQGQTKSITFALFDRKTLLTLGGLDESLPRNQDNDLVARLIDHGTRYWRVDAKATYLAPKSVAGLLRRAWLNGAWSVWGHHRGRGGHSWWHFVPMAAVGMGVTLAVLVAMGADLAAWCLLVLAGAYAVLALCSATAAAIPRRALWAIPVLPFLFLAHHVFYGLGSWSAVIRPNPIPPRSPQTK